MLENSHKPYLAQYIGSQLKTLRRIQEGAPYLLCTYYFPPELLQLFDIEALYIERIVGLTVSTGLYTESSDALPETICSYQSAFASLVERKILPKPRCLLAMEFPCPDAVRLMEYLQETYQIPLVRITRENMRQDLQRAVDFLHSHYERSRSESEVSRLFNRANEYKRKIDEMRMRYPGIADSTDMLALFTVENDFGGQTAVDVLEGYYACLRQRAATWRPSGNHRIIWMGLIPLYDNHILEWLENRLPIRFVWEEMWMFDHPNCPSPELSPGRYVASVFYAHLEDRLKGSLFYRPDSRRRRLLDIAEKLHVRMGIDLLQENCSFLPPAVAALRSGFEKKRIAFRTAACDVVRRREGQREKLAGLLEDGLRQSMATGFRMRRD